MDAVASFTALNPADKSVDVTLSNANLTAAGANGGSRIARSVAGKTTGKWYYEVDPATVTGGTCLGVGNSSSDLNNFTGVDLNGIAYYADGATLHNNINISVGTGWNQNNIIGVAINLDTDLFWVAKDGVWQNGDPAAGTGGRSFAITGTTYAIIAPGGGAEATVNFGSTAFIYTAPTGFTGWSV